MNLDAVTRSEAVEGGSDGEGDEVESDPEVNLETVTRSEAVEGGSDGEGSVDLDRLQPG